MKALEEHIMLPKCKKFCIDDTLYSSKSKRNLLSFKDIRSNGYHIETKVINTVSEPVSVCPVERNISVPADFGIPFQGVSGFLKNNLYIFL